MKNFNVPFDYVLNDISFCNVIMYNRTIPEYDFESKENTSKKHKGVNLLELDNNEWNNFLKDN